MNNQPLAILRSVFGYEQFRAPQAEVIDTLMHGGDALVLMPTGGGKSLCFQIPAIALPGTGLVISPLIALMQDQVAALKQAGVRAAFLNSTLDAETARAIEQQLLNGELDLLYVSPERLMLERTLNLLARARLALFAIDEAHCASPLGHDFRPAYRRFAARAKRWCASPGWQPPTAALTGTAGPETLVSACAALGLARPVPAAAQARPELTFLVDMRRGEPRQRLRRLLSEPLGCARFDSGLVFCPHVDGPMGAVEVAEELLWTENREVDCYTGRAPRGRKEEDWAGIKTQAARRFLSGEVPLLCCTRAFGLGVHKPDIRYTVHLGLPPSLAAFHQEAGRAG
ncbi:MAG: RecQ family ATP-dependent DNA helicase, partial [Pseudomonadota bacterium]